MREIGGETCYSIVGAPEVFELRKQESVCLYIDTSGVLAYVETITILLLMVELYPCIGNNFDVEVLVNNGFGCCPGLFVQYTTA